jgi:hypothetical protein
MKSSIFWHIKPYDALKVNRRFAGTCYVHLQGLLSTYLMLASCLAFIRHRRYGMFILQISLNVLNFLTVLLCTSQYSQFTALSCTALVPTRFSTASVKVKVKLTLRLAVYHQSVRLGVKPLETHEQNFFFN